MNLHTHTPTVVAVDSRGLPVRHIDYCRNEPYAHAFPRLTRQAFDAARRKLSSTDPRLDLPSSRVVHDLAGEPRLTESVDAGWQLSLRGQAGQLLETWDSRNSRSCLHYDELLRVTAIAEQLQEHPWRVVERLEYGDAGEQSSAQIHEGEMLPMGWAELKARIENEAWQKEISHSAFAYAEKWAGGWSRATVSGMKIWLLNL